MNMRLIVLAFLVSFMASCSGGSDSGILGIQVPVGDGRVSAETPYVITGVYENSPAYKAGIRPDDVIIQIDDMIISRGMKYDDIYNNHLVGKAGAKVIIYVQRGDKNMVFEVVRAKR